MTSCGWPLPKKGFFGVKSFTNVMVCHDCVLSLEKVFGGLRFR
jgi:hypothetical protein